MYRITVDLPSRIIRADLSGFFTADEVAAFGQDEQAAAQSLGCSSGQFGVLISAVDGTVQTQHVICEFDKLMASLPLQASRIALVAESALLKLQLKRVLPSGRAQVFESCAAAIKWLKERPIAENGVTSRSGSHTADERPRSPLDHVKAAIQQPAQLRTFSSK